jgi:serine/threonine-protein kinase PknG
LEGMDRHRLTKQVLETALNLLTSKQLQAAGDLKILGQPLQEVHLRKGLEKALRDMAHLASGNEKIHLVDEANKIRPRTLI